MMTVPGPRQTAVSSPRSSGPAVAAILPSRTASVVTGGASPARVCTVRATMMRSAAWPAMSAPSSASHRQLPAGRRRNTSVLPLAPERTRQRVLRLRGDAVDHVGGGPHAGDEVDGLAGPYRPRQLAAGHAAPVPGLPLGVRVELRRPVPPGVVKRVVKG